MKWDDEPAIDDNNIMGCKCICIYYLSRWWFQTIFYFHPYLGKWSNLTNIFKIDWNHQLVIYIYRYKSLVVTEIGITAVLPYPLNGDRRIPPVAMYTTHVNYSLRMKYVTPDFLVTARFKLKSSTFFIQLHIPQPRKRSEKLQFSSDIEDDACAGDSDSQPREEGTLRLDPLMRVKPLRSLKPNSHCAPKIDETPKRKCKFPKHHP